MHKESIYRRYEPAVTSHFDNNVQSYWFVFCSNKLLTTVDQQHFYIPYLVSLQELNLFPVRTQYLGTLQGNPCYSAEVSPETATPENMTFIDLRSLYSLLEADIFLLAGRAIQIVTWDQTNQYCGRCGTPLEELEGERAKKCPNCELVIYPRISPAVITAIIRDNKILLAHAKSFTGNMHSIIAGFVEPGETLEDCVKREIMEEVSIQVKNIRYFGSQCWPFPNSLMIGFIAEYESGEICVDGVEISEADWYDANNLPELPSNMSIAKKLINWYIENYSGK